MINIAIINHSTAVIDTDFKNVVSALQTQVTRDFYPIWGINAKLMIMPLNASIPPDWWQLIILDNSDQAGALGYHDLTSFGKPLGKVFAGDDIKYGYKWSITTSHELLEMLGDPDINLCVFSKESSTKAQLYAYEVCDACEDDQFGYNINGVMVSDFVRPEWFEITTSPPHGKKYDFGGHITAPFQLLSGGYIGVYNITKNSGWTQLTHSETVPVQSIPQHSTIPHEELKEKQIAKHKYDLKSKFTSRHSRYTRRTLSHDERIKSKTH